MQQDSDTSDSSDNKPPTGRFDAAQAEIDARVAQTRRLKAATLLDKSSVLPHNSEYNRKNDINELACVVIEQLKVQDPKTVHNDFLSFSSTPERKAAIQQCMEGIIMQKATSKSIIDKPKVIRRIIRNYEKCLNFTVTEECLAKVRELHAEWKHLADLYTEERRLDKVKHINSFNDTEARLRKFITTCSIVQFRHLCTSYISPPCRIKEQSNISFPVSRKDYNHSRNNQIKLTIGAIHRALQKKGQFNLGLLEFSQSFFGFFKFMLTTGLRNISICRMTLADWTISSDPLRNHPAVSYHKNKQGNKALSDSSVRKIAVICVPTHADPTQDSLFSIGLLIELQLLLDPTIVHDQTKQIFSYCASKRESGQWKPPRGQPMSVRSKSRVFDRTQNPHEWTARRGADLMNGFLDVAAMGAGFGEVRWKEYPDQLYWPYNKRAHLLRAVADGKLIKKKITADDRNRQLGWITGVEEKHYALAHDLAAKNDAPLALVDRYDSQTAMAIPAHPLWDFINRVPDWLLPESARNVAPPNEFQNGVVVKRINSQCPVTIHCADRDEPISFFRKAFRIGLAHGSVYHEDVNAFFKHLTDKPGFKEFRTLIQQHCTRELTNRAHESNTTETDLIQQMTPAVRRYVEGLKRRLRDAEHKALVLELEKHSTGSPSEGLVESQDTDPSPLAALYKKIESVEEFKGVIAKLSEYINQEDFHTLCHETVRRQILPAIILLTERDPNLPAFVLPQRTSEGKLLVSILAVSILMAKFGASSLQRAYKQGTSRSWRGFVENRKVDWKPYLTTPRALLGVMQTPNPQ